MVHPVLILYNPWKNPSFSDIPKRQVPGTAVRQVHIPLPKGGPALGKVRDSPRRPGKADGHREEEDLRHCQRPRGRADDDQGELQISAELILQSWES